MSLDGDSVPGGPFEVVQRVDEDRIVVRADLDLSLAEPLRRRAMALLEGDGDRRLTVDLTAVPFLDSSGVQALVRLAGTAEPGGFRVIAGGQPYQVLELTEVLKLLAIVPVPCITALLTSSDMARRTASAVPGSRRRASTIRRASAGAPEERGISARRIETLTARPPARPPGASGPR